MKLMAAWKQEVQVWFCEGDPASFWACHHYPWVRRRTGRLQVVVKQRAMELTSEGKDGEDCIR